MSEFLEGETIAAIATPPGRGGVGIVRISGTLVREIAKKILGELPKPRHAFFSSFYNANGQVIDKGLALYFKAPHSFTGEDILELQGHGGPLVMDMLLKSVLYFGAKMAGPGEFSTRAFLNGKVDLAQAEAIADLINASTEQAAMSASRSLQGAFSEKVKTIGQKMQHLRMMVEAAIDFPDEEIDFLTKEDISGKIKALSDEILALFAQTKQGELLKEGMTVAIVGQPNAGKSSLLNALTQKESAIVTPIAGTTRDLVKETIQIDGMPVHIIDTAGIRLEASLVEQEGINRAKAQLPLVDRILLVMDVSVEKPFSDIEETILKEHSHKVTQIFNKIDKTVQAPREDDNKIFLSAKNADGIEYLLSHLKKCMGYKGSEEALFTARRRHLNALEKTKEHALAAYEQLIKAQALELCAQELRQGQDALGEIVGKVSSDDLLGQIFSQFCIGK